MFTCQDGKCELPACKASKLTVEDKLQSSPLLELFNDVIKRVGDPEVGTPYLKINQVELVLDATKKTGEECCESCSKPLEPVTYEEEGGTLELGAEVVVIVPGTGFLVPEINKEFLGGRVKVTGEFSFGLGGRGKLSMKGDFMRKDSVCLDHYCFSSGFTGDADLKVGVIGKLVAKLEHCRVSGPDACTELFGAEADINSTFNIGVTAIGKWYSESCVNKSCSNVRIDPLEFEAQASVKIRISRFVSRTWQVKEVFELRAGYNNNGCK